MDRKSLYFLIIGGFIAAHVLVWFYIHDAGIAALTSCPIKKATGVACPSCGGTRAIALFYQGDWIKSLLTNPLGMILLFVGWTALVLVIFDLLFQKNRTAEWYLKVENLFKKKGILIPFLLLLFLNWIWNIYKGL